MPHKQRNKNPPGIVDFRRIFGRGDRIRTCEISWSQTKRDTKLRHTPMAFFMWSPLWSNMWSAAVFLMVFRFSVMDGTAGVSTVSGAGGFVRGGKAYTLPKQARYQLRYTPVSCGIEYIIFSRQSQGARQKTGKGVHAAKNGRVRAELPPDPRPAFRTGTVFPLLPAEQPRDALYDPAEEAQHFCQKRGGCPVGLRGVRVLLFAGVQP